MNRRSCQHSLDMDEFGLLHPMTAAEDIPANALVAYEDAALPGLRAELLDLECKVRQLSAAREAHLDKIRAFNQEYQRRLGDLVRKLEDIRQQFFVKLNPPGPEIPPKSKKTRGGSKEDSEWFTNKEKESLREPLLELSEKDREEIKKDYRQAGRLCHPDIVDEDKKRQAGEIFKELNAAYKKADKLAVKRILAGLQNGEYFAGSSDVISNKALLERKIRLLKEEQIRHEGELERIRNDRIFRAVSSIDNLDAYFDLKKEELEYQINILLIRSALLNLNEAVFFTGEK